MKRSVFWRGPNGTGDSGDWLVVFLRAVFSRASCVVAHYDGTNATAVPAAPEAACVEHCPESDAEGSPRPRARAPPARP